MKLLADAICQSTRVDLYDARDLLVKPAINHSTQAPMAMVDRFAVVNAMDVMDRLSGMGEDQLSGMVVAAKAILPRFWIEWQSLDGEKAKVGCLVNVEVLTGVMCAKLYAGFSGHLSFVGSGKFIGEDVVCAAKTTAAMGFCKKYLTFLPLLLVAISSPRAASTERVHPMSTRANRRMAQRGAPMHSHNLVTLKLPQPSSQRHESQRGDFLGTVREHWVRGHWRLIINTTEPYFVWVDGHKAGNEAMGTVTKTHLVSVGHTASRKGMTVPSHTGKKGERVVAH